MAAHGRFLPNNPHKYVGDASKIFFRSSWELQVMKWMDSRDAVMRWGSEEINIAYLSPLDSRVHQYYPDFFIEYKDLQGNILKEIVEVKPLHESDADFAKHQRSKDALVVNNAKWKAAAIWCEQRGMKFRVITEKSIYHQGAPKEKKQRKKKDLTNG